MVLDSFALMALFQEEPGAAKVQELLEGAAGGEHELYMSVVNLGEVAYTVENRRGLEASQEVLAANDQLPIAIVDVDQELALRAARLKATTGIGYADCFAAALAQRLGAAVVTGDPDFRQVEHLVDIDWLPATEP
jgi:predicted nucleic acid-binding protein